MPSRVNFDADFDEEVLMTTSPSKKEQPERPPLSSVETSNWLFNDFLAFLDAEDQYEEGKLNCVLLGYWCTAFKSFIDSHPKQVYSFLYQRSGSLEKLIKHMYSPQMCDLVVKLLNFSKSVFDERLVSEEQAQEVRADMVSAIVNHLGHGYSFED